MRTRLAVTIALVLLVLGTGFDPWQTTWRETRQGNRALEEGNPGEAVRHYTEALSRSPDDPRILFDLGNALARAGRLDEARQAWERAANLGQGTIRRDAWYNRGLAELLAGDARSAAAAFTRALLVDPSDREARRNLDLALRRLRQQQQPQPRGGKGKKKEQEQRQERGSRGRQGRKQQERQQGAPPDRQQEPRQGDRGRNDRQEAGRRQQPPESGKGPGDRQSRAGDRRQRTGRGGNEARDREAQEMAERLLRRLARDEKAALRRALRRRVPAGRTKKGKDW